MRYLIVLMLAGCAGMEETCIEAKLKEGDRMKNLQTGRVGTIRTIHGPSPRCAVPGWPNLADVQY